MEPEPHSSRASSNASISYCASCRATRGSVGSDANGVSPTPERKGSILSINVIPPSDTQQHHHNAHVPAPECLCTLLKRVKIESSGRRSRNGSASRSRRPTVLATVNGGDANESVAGVYNDDAARDMSLADGEEHDHHHVVVTKNNMHGPTPASPMLAEFCREVGWGHSSTPMVVGMTSSSSPTSSSNGDSSRMDVDGEDDTPLDPLSTGISRLEWLRQNVDVITSALGGPGPNTSTPSHGA